MTIRGGWEPTGFAERLRAVRMAKGLSQTALAEKVSITNETLSRLERGANEPPWPLVLRLARALEVTPDAFLPAEPVEVKPPPVKPATKRGRPSKARAAGKSATEPAGGQDAAKGKPAAGKGKARKGK